MTDYRTMQEYSADVAHRKRRARLNGEPEWQRRCAFCGDVVEEGTAHCGEFNHNEMEPECPECGNEVDPCHSLVTGIETTVWKCNNCNWVSDPE